MRIAMWSGPRNISTTMMYAFAARGDTAVMDEPFYAAYLARTGIDHPMREDVIAAGETDPSRVAAAMVAPVPEGKALTYQKHMCQHMIPGVPIDWMAETVNVFLIRHPARVVASYLALRSDPDPEDLGFRRQAELFDAAREMTGAVPIVIDASDIRADPGAVLAALCGALGIAYDARMLSWPSGGHADDGVWAPVWYNAVHKSTGFAGPEGPLPVLEGRAAALEAELLPDYERLRAFAL